MRRRRVPSPSPLGHKDTTGPPLAPCAARWSLPDGYLRQFVNTHVVRRSVPLVAICDRPAARTWAATLSLLPSIPPRGVRNAAVFDAKHRFRLRETQKAFHGFPQDAIALLQRAYCFLRFTSRPFNSMFAGTTCRPDGLDVVAFRGLERHIPVLP
nr:hypothetical protein CFP56_31736 [Quercus suber]